MPLLRASAAIPATRPTVALVVPSTRLCPRSYPISCQGTTSMSDCNKRLAYEAFSGQANFDTYYGSSGSLGSYGSLCMNLFTTKSELQSAVHEW